MRTRPIPDYQRHGKAVAKTHPLTISSETYLDIPQNDPLWIYPHWLPSNDYLICGYRRYGKERHRIVECRKCAVKFMAFGEEIVQRHCLRHDDANSAESSAPEWIPLELFRICETKKCEANVKIEAVVVQRVECLICGIKLTVFGPKDIQRHMSSSYCRVKAFKHLQLDNSVDEAMSEYNDDISSSSFYIDKSLVVSDSAVVTSVANAITRNDSSIVSEMIAVPSSSTKAPVPSKVTPTSSSFNTEKLPTLPVDAFVAPTTGTSGQVGVPAVSATAIVTATNVKIPVVSKETPAVLDALDELLEEVAESHFSASPLSSTFSSPPSPQSIRPLCSYSKLPVKIAVRKPYSEMPIPKPVSEARIIKSQPQVIKPLPQKPAPRILKPVPGIIKRVLQSVQKVPQNRQLSAGLPNDPQNVLIYPDWIPANEFHICGFEPCGSRDPIVECLKCAYRFVAMNKQQISEHQWRHAPISQVPEWIPTNIFQLYQPDEYESRRRFCFKMAKCLVCKSRVSVASEADVQVHLESYVHLNAMKIMQRTKNEAQPAIPKPPTPPEELSPQCPTNEKMNPPTVGLAKPTISESNEYSSISNSFIPMYFSQILQGHLQCLLCKLITLGQPADAHFHMQLYHPVQYDVVCKIFKLEKASQANDEAAKPIPRMPHSTECGSVFPANNVLLAEESQKRKERQAFKAPGPAKSAKLWNSGPGSSSASSPELIAPRIQSFNSSLRKHTLSLHIFSFNISCP